MHVFEYYSDPSMIRACNKYIVSTVYVVLRGILYIAGDMKDLEVTTQGYLTH